MSKYHKAAWDDESRQRQHEVIMKHKPWLKSTGAKTVEGKAISKMNALKTDPHLYALMKEMNSIMKQQKEIFNTINNTCL
ncbi:hypothetical protein ACLHDG_00175 [Sulfurovum sp. CS9]|uniref:hypothetical protein n=1 Tax=Sulfurovum sp. CS9 TaxID=3391146 RepID=UPI0039EB1BAE